MEFFRSIRQMTRWCFLQGAHAAVLHALRLFLQGGSRRPPAPPAVPPALWYFWLVRALWRLAGSTHVAQSFTPLPPFMAKAGLCIAPRLPHPGEASPGTPSLLSSRFVAYLGCSLHTLCRQIAPTKLPKIPTVSHKAVNHGRFPQAESPCIRLQADRSDSLFR